VRSEVAHTLGKLAPSDCAHEGIMPALQQLAKDDSPEVRERAEESLRLL
jgi:hypothetical protein